MSVNIETYEVRLRQLLAELYLKQKQGIATGSKEKIEGFIEAGLAAEIIDRSRIEEIINQSYREVFGIEFSQRELAQTQTFLDIQKFIENIQGEKV